ncbi:MAG: exo-alpha-sialidase [Fibrobacteraceae bacterium]|nr:exo-alpha-sialidase [Fibrobacteraceae bacterium]
MNIFQFSRRAVLSILGSCFALSSYAADDYSWGNVRFDGGGFVSAVLFHPKAENLLYARTDVGGIYRWAPDAKRWIPLMDQFNENDKGLYGTESFALDPTDPKRIYVLGGTGYFSKGHTAVLRSQDFGATWDTTYVHDIGILAHGNGMGRQTGEKLAVDPNLPSTVLCGSRTGGVFKSTDYGKTWASLYKVALSDAKESSLNGVNGVSFVMFDESQGKLADGSTGTIYIGISEKTDNLQVSKDGGKTWNAIKGGPANLMPHRAKIVDGDMFITYADGPGPHSINSGAVYKYNIAGGTWTDITPFDSVQHEGSTAKAYEKDGSSYGGIAIDPKDKNHIVVSTLGKYTGRHHYADETENYGDRIYVTTDGGKTWKHGQHYDDGFNVEVNGTPWIHGNAIHWAGSLEFNPFNNKEMWVTSGNGIFQTDDITKPVPVWKFQSRGIEETVPLDVVSIPGGPLVTAIGDYDGSVYDNPNNAANRHSPTIGTTESMGYAAQTGTLVRTGVITVYGQYEAINYNVMYRSDDMGKTWDSVKTTLKGSKGLVVLTADGKVILHRPDQSAQVYRSDDNGATWTETKTGEQTQYARIVADPVDAKTLYVMNSMGTLYKSSDGGKTFDAQANRLQNEGAEEYYNGGGLIRTVPKREGHLWVPLDQSQMWLAKGYSENGLAYTEDGGKSWSKCEGANAAIAVGIGKAKEGADYETIFIWGNAKADDSIGIYRSTDKCKTFERVNDDMHQFGGPGNGNFVQGDMNNFGVVYMSTVGRGLIMGAPTDSEFLTTHKHFVSAKPTSMIYSNRSLYLDDVPSGKLTVMDVQGRVVLAQNIVQNSVVSLEKLPMSKYVARVVDQKGKVLAQKTFVLK